MAESTTPAAKKAPPEPEEPKLSVEELLNNARPLTGHSRHILAGALNGQTGTYTAAQAKRKADEFAKRKVEA